METALVKASDYGLEESKAAEVEGVFLPIVAELENLDKDYQKIMGSEITPEIAKSAGELRWKMVKLRTNTGKIHKATKAFYLAGGRFVDAWKTKNVVVIEQMEEKLADIENYYERLEAERLDKLRQERQMQVGTYTDTPAMDLQNMEEETYLAYLAGIKLAYEIRIEEEAKAEAEKLAKKAAIELHRTRKESILKLWAFADAEIEYANFGTMEAPKWEETKLILSTRKEKREAEILEAKVENERLVKEIAASVSIKEEALARQKAEADAIDAEFSRVAKIALDAAKAETARLAKEIADAKAESDRLEADKLAEAEKEKADKLAELKAPDKVKLIAWVVKLQIEMPDMKNESAKATANEIADKFEGFKKWANSQIEKL